MSFAKQMDPEFHLEPLNGSGQCIINPINIPISKEGVELYYQHRVVADGIRGKVNVTMSHTMGDMKDLSTLIPQVPQSRQSLRVSCRTWPRRNLHHRSHVTNWPATFGPLNQNPKEALKPENSNSKSLNNGLISGGSAGSGLLMACALCDIHANATSRLFQSYYIGQKCRSVP
jgi:hypothetical protein